MNNEQKALVKTTVPILREHGLALTKYFYNRMFEHNPELKNVFNLGNQQTDKQQKALAMAVLAYAEHIDDPSVLLGSLDHIGQKHTSLQIRKEHYLIVGQHLISSIAEVLGSGASEELLDAWREAYGELAALMSGREQTVYDGLASTKGSWSGWKPFIVDQKINESTEITSFFFRPADGAALPDFLPGQYISVRLYIPELNVFQPRQYSLSAAPNGRTFRISVKREKHTLRPEGIISNRLHDFIEKGGIIDVSAPAGQFVLTEEETPVVFISGGVGQTPLMSMLHQLIQTRSEREIAWIHGCRNEEVHAFREILEKWSAENENISPHLFYEHLSSDDPRIRQGIVDLDRLPKELVDNSATYYICGPAPFIEMHYRKLVGSGIERSKIKFEEFGPQELVLDN